MPMHDKHRITPLRITSRISREKIPNNVIATLPTVIIDQSMFFLAHESFFFFSKVIWCNTYGQFKIV